MERKESGFNQMEFNKVLLDNVIKTQLSMAKVLGISSLSPHVAGIEKFEYKKMVPNIQEDTQAIIAKFFNIDNEDDE